MPSQTIKHDWGWMCASILFVAGVLLCVRFTTGILHADPVFDEQYITVPMNDIIEKGWSVQTAIDFEETKGPALIWPYAILGDWFGGSLNALRFVSLLASIASVTVLAFIASLCGVRRSGHFAIAIGWLLLPYCLVFSEIVMGEVSFMLLELLAVAVFLRTLQHEPQKQTGWVAPVLFGLLVAIALHSRIHVVAVVGAVCIVAYIRCGIKSWPWWVAGAIAGLLRIPLWIRWEGLVSPKYQNIHGLGFRLESLSYLAAALAPLVGLFAVGAWKTKSYRKSLVCGGVFAFALVFVAMPDLFVPESIDFGVQTERFQGIVSTAVRLVTGNVLLQQFLIAVLAAVGLSGLIGLHVNSRTVDGSVYEAVIGIAFWSLALGWILYAFTEGFVFDRFLLVWAFLLPIIWWKLLPRCLFALQCIAMGIIVVRLVVVWL